MAKSVIRTRLVQVAGVALAACAVWITVRSVVAQSYRGRPLTAKYVVTATQKAQPPQHKELFLAVRSDGSRVRPRLTKGPDGRMYEQKVVIDLSRGKRVVAEGLTQSLTTYALSAEEVKALGYPRSRCTEEPAAQRSKVLGYDVVLSSSGRGRSDSFPAAQSANLESWVAPALGCIPLLERFTIVDSTGLSTVFEKRAVEVRLGEPDPSLFAVPEWTERSPSQVNQLVAQRFGSEPPGLDEGDVQADRAYFARQDRR